MGTVGYAAPEQFRAAPADIRSDLYSFGILCRNILNQCARMEKAEHTRWLSLIEKATSFEAEDLMLDIIGSNKTKKVVDKISASYILEDFLNGI